MADGSSFQPRGRRATALPKAEAFLMIHACSRFSSSRLSDAVHLSERAIQKLFQDAHAMTPRRWHFVYRLRCVRRDLLATPLGEVTPIALKWGFVELGRFAQQYREHFGERPSETVRRVRSAMS
jgi:transcriptional regulator GlxA family with amidase domain